MTLIAMAGTYSLSQLHGQIKHTTVRRPFTYTKDHELHDQLCSDIWTKYDDYLSYRCAAHPIISKYLILRPEITQEVQELFTQNLEGHYCIGVHVRYATVHGLEVPGGKVPELQDYYGQIDMLLAQLHDESVKIYLATDSQLVIEQFVQRYPKHLLVFLQNAHRSSIAWSCLM